VSARGSFPDSGCRSSSLHQKQRAFDRGAAAQGPYPDANPQEHVSRVMSAAVVRHAGGRTPMRIDRHCRRGFSKHPLRAASSQRRDGVAHPQLAAKDARRLVARLPHGHETTTPRTTDATGIENLEFLVSYGRYLVALYNLRASASGGSAGEHRTRALPSADRTAADGAGRLTPMPKQGAVNLVDSRLAPDPRLTRASAVPPMDKPGETPWRFPPPCPQVGGLPNKLHSTPATRQDEF